MATMFDMPPGPCVCLGPVVREGGERREKRGWGGEEKCADAWQPQERGVRPEAWDGSWHGWCQSLMGSPDHPLHLGQVALATPVVLTSQLCVYQDVVTVAVCGGR
jgi:hypothetical protein